MSSNVNTTSFAAGVVGALVGSTPTMQGDGGSLSFWVGFSAVLVAVLGLILDDRWAVRGLESW